MSGIRACYNKHGSGTYRDLLDNGQFISNRSGPVTAIRDVHQRLEKLGPEVAARRSDQLSRKAREVIPLFDPGT